MRIEELSFVKAFIRLATDGDRRGWHERNGGNLSYRMTDADINACSAQFDTAAPWIPVKTAVPLLAGDCILLTGSGKCMRNIAAAPTDTVGIIELNGRGDAPGCGGFEEDGGCRKKSRYLSCPSGASYRADVYSPHR